MNTSFKAEVCEEVLGSKVRSGVFVAPPDFKSGTLWSVLKDGQYGWLTIASGLELGRAAQLVHLLRNETAQDVYLIFREDA